MRSDTARNRAALIDAARRVFESDGLDAPLEDVAAAAGLSRTSLHRHFASRGELIAAIWEADVSETEADADRFAGHPDAFVRVFDGILAQQVDRRTLHPSASQIESPELASLAQRFLAVVARAYRDSAAAGWLMPGVTEASAQRAVYMAIAAIWVAPTRDERLAVQADVRGILLRGLLARELP